VLFTQRKIEIINAEAQLIGGKVNYLMSIVWANLVGFIYLASACEPNRLKIGFYKILGFATATLIISFIIYNFH